jgi:hypothetical protein
MKKHSILWVSTCIVALALVLLLIYSFERTSWLFKLFEQEVYPAYAAALVVEVAAVALIAGAGAIAQLDSTARAWANRALLAVLSVQALANLSAGYLRGGRTTLAQFGTADDYAAYAVASTLWLVANLAVPALVLCLSKLLERLIGKLLHVTATAEAMQAPITRPLMPALAQERHVPSVERASVALDRICPGCGRALSAGQYGAAKRYGYCGECKA